MIKLSITDLENKTLDEIKSILKSEGNTNTDDPQFNEWWEVFELEMLCKKSGLSELEKWCVLRNRFKLTRRE